MPLQFHNTLTRKTENFTSQESGKATLYTCGPTVYDFPHVGNWVAYIYWDTLVRTLRANDYEVERVMNITDVGHLTSDADEGEDKLEKGARREGKTAWDVAKFYTDDFLAGMKRLNLIMPEHITKATDYIDQQLALVRTLKEKGYTYQIDDGIYFDTAKFPTYADFAQLDLEAQKAGARVTFNDEKRNPSDFALWKFTPAGEKRDMEWETPKDLLDTPARVTRGGAAPTEPSKASEVGADRAAGPVDSDLRKTAHSSFDDESGEEQIVMGFPGWHLECSAMAMNILGSTLDIHTGGIDHIPVHHTNEIAQSEAASEVRFSNFWLHNNHMKVNGTKISKSLGNGYTLDDLQEHGFSAMDYRLFVLQSHYRSEGNFTFENVEAAHNRLAHWRSVAALRHQAHDTIEDDDKKTVTLRATSQAIIEALNDDLNTPEALKIIDEAFAKAEAAPISRLHQHSFSQLIETIDETLGLGLAAASPDISDDQKQLIIQRERVREAKDWQTSDTLRDQLAEQGIAIRDTSDGTIWEHSA